MVYLWSRRKKILLLTKTESIENQKIVNTVRTIKYEYIYSQKSPEKRKGKREKPKKKKKEEKKKG